MQKKEIARFIVPLLWVLAVIYFCAAIVLKGMFPDNKIIYFVFMAVGSIRYIVGFSNMYDDAVKRNRYVSRSLGFHIIMSSALIFFAAFI